MNWPITLMRLNPIVYPKSVWLFFLFVFFFFFIHGQHPSSKKFLAKEPIQYICDNDRVDITQWMTGTTRKFDSKGIILNNNQYHPLGIIHFGLLSYNHYKLTKDSVYYKHFVNQIHYFKDTSKVDYLDNGFSLGLPYTFNFKDLKAPWYSGMTQGWAIVFLFRYYYHSRDEEALDLIKKIAHLMLKPAELNGSISKNPEGYTWIEEYPNSKQKPQVLNGYINGLLGLKEYTDFFVEDTMAKRIHDETYLGLKQTLSNYDTPTWTGYDRKGSPVSNMYIQYEVFEMLDLYRVYGDEQFLDQMKLWCFMGHKKYLTEKNVQFKLLAFDLSAKMEKWQNGCLTTRYVKNNALQSKDTSLAKLINHQKPYESLILGKSYTVSFDVNSRQSVNSGYILMDSSYQNKKLEIELMDITQKKIRVKALRVAFGGLNLYTFSLPTAMRLTSMSVTYKKGDNPLLTILDAALVMNTTYSIPFYTFHTTEPKQLLKPNYNVKIGKVVNGEQLTIFYKQAVKKEDLSKVKWQTTHKLDTKNAIFSAVEGNYYQFLIMYKPNFNQSIFEGFELVE